MDTPCDISKSTTNERSGIIVSQTMDRETPNKESPDLSDDINVLSGDNQVDVEIEPDVKDNTTHLQLCACSIVLNCFTRNSVAKN